MKAEIGIVFTFSIYFVNLIEAPVGKWVEKAHMRHICKAFNDCLVRLERMEDLPDTGIMNVQYVLLLYLVILHSLSKFSGVGHLLKFRSQADAPRFR